MRRSNVRRMFALRSECRRRSSSSTPITRMPGAALQDRMISAPNKARADQTVAGASVPSAMAGANGPRSDRHLLLRTRLGRRGLGDSVSR